MLLGALSLLAVPSCKKGEDSADDGASSSAPLPSPNLSSSSMFGKALDDVTKDDLASVLASLGWRTVENWEKIEGPTKTSLVVGVKDGEMRSLTLGLFRMPTSRFGAWKQQSFAYVIETHGSTVIGVKFTPPDRDGAAKVLAQVMGR
jgi:hypothetical protein